MNSWPTTKEELQAVYDRFEATHGNSGAIREMAAAYGAQYQTARLRLIRSGVRTVKATPECPDQAELASAYVSAVAEYGQRSAIGRLAVVYGATHTTIRKWLAEGDMRKTTPRVPATPITTPCPCGAVATTRYRGQDPPLCFRCYMRTYAADKDSKFRKTARAYVAEAKRDIPCADCGGTFPPCCMHFDHVPERGPKLFNLGAASHSIKAVQAEIEKCDIVCANCHAIRTWISRGKPLDEAV